MNLLEPTNHRISNSLFDAINKVRNGVTESTVATEGAVDKAHFCATHVEHSLLGKGTCISEQHAEPDENGNIAWYSVEFPSGIQRVNTSNLKIVEGKSHTHGKKMAEEEEVAAEETVEEGNDGNLANNYPPYDKVTRGDVIAGRLGKDQMGGKKKKVKESAPIRQDKTDFNDADAPVSKSTEDKEKKSAMSKAVSTHKMGKGGTDAPKASTVGEARSTGTVFDKPKENPLTKDITSAFNKKSTSTGTVYSRKPEPKATTGASGATGKKAKNESITQTIINHNDFVLEVTDNPTYGDYLKALQFMVGQANEDVQQEIVTIATEAFKENYTDVIIESQTKKIFESKFDEIRKSGAKVLGENYMVDSGEPYVEYTVEKDGKAIQYVHLGTIKKV